MGKTKVDYPTCIYVNYSLVVFYSQLSHSNLIKLKRLKIILCKKIENIRC